MEITLQEIVFYVVAAAIAVCSVLAVTTGKILRAATYLLFVLFGTGAIYGILGYTFLAATAGHRSTGAGCRSAESFSCRNCSSRSKVIVFTLL